MRLWRWLTAVLAIAVVAASWGCTVDPGPNFVIPLSVFNADYFYCHVEPEYLFAQQTQCGAGQASDGNGCHFNSSRVSGMVLQNHPMIDCGGGDHPANDAAGTGAIGPGTPATNNFSAASLEMSRNCTDYSTCQAPILLRPTSTNAHPRQIYCDPGTTDGGSSIPCSSASTPQIPGLEDIIFTWATTP